MFYLPAVSDVDPYFQNVQATRIVMATACVRYLSIAISYVSRATVIYMYHFKQIIPSESSKNKFKTK